MRLRSVLLFFSSSLMLGSRAMHGISAHFKCRGGLYPRTSIKRFHVSDSQLRWATPYPDYKPPNYTSPSVYGKPWADPEIDCPGFEPKWNSLDDKVDRQSYTGKYMVVNGYPLNPIGRTGIAGRGLFGRWGPNHAADPVVTRWKRLHTGDIATDDKKRPIVQVVVIKRRDSGEWALPGGMVDPGEHVSAAAVREFQEEATNSLQMTDDQKQFWNLEFEKFFNGGDEVYKGYVDDPRNTDNSWVETIAYNFHDDSGQTVGGLKLNAGDDAVGVQWVDIEPNLNLYASHKVIVDKVREKLINYHDQDNYK